MKKVFAVAAALVFAVVAFAVVSVHTSSHAGIAEANDAYIRS